MTETAEATDRWIGKCPMCAVEEIVLVDGGLRCVSCEAQGIDAVPEDDPCTITPAGEIHIERPTRGRRFYDIRIHPEGTTLRIVLPSSNSPWPGRVTVDGIGTLPLLALPDPGRWCEAPGCRKTAIEGLRFCCRYNCGADHHRGSCLLHGCGRGARNHRSWFCRVHGSEAGLASTADWPGPDREILVRSMQAFLHESAEELAGFVIQGAAPAITMRVINETALAVPVMLSYSSAPPTTLHISGGSGGGSGRRTPVPREQLAPPRPVPPIPADNRHPFGIPWEIATHGALPSVDPQSMEAALSSAPLDTFRKCIQGNCADHRAPGHAFCHEHLATIRR